MTIKNSKEYNTDKYISLSANTINVNNKLPNSKTASISI